MFNRSNWDRKSELDEKQAKTVNSAGILLSFFEAWRECKNAEMLAKVQHDLFNVRYFAEIIIIIIIIIIYRLYLHNTNQLNLNTRLEMFEE